MKWCHYSSYKMIKNLIIKLCLKFRNYRIYKLKIMRISKGTINNYQKKYERILYQLKMIINLWIIRNKYRLLKWSNIQVVQIQMNQDKMKIYLIKNKNLLTARSLEVQGFCIGIVLKKAIQIINDHNHHQNTCSKNKNKICLIKMKI